MSSARERRRKSKQGGGRGRVVLKSRSASDLCKNDGKKDSTPLEKGGGGMDEPDYAISPEMETKDEPNSVPRLEIRRGSSELDFATPPEMETKDEPNSAPRLEIRRGSSESDFAVPLEEREGPSGVIIDPRNEHVDHQKAGQKDLHQDHRVQSDFDYVGQSDGAVSAMNGHASDEVEVEEFFTLLDTTLHLPESPLSPAPFDSEDHPGPPVAAFSGVHQHFVEEGERTLPPGRLADRIKALRE